MTYFDHYDAPIINPFDIFVYEVDEYIEESSRNKYLIFVSTDKNEQVLTKYIER